MAQPCGEAGCTISIRAATSEPVYRTGEPLIYTLTVQNTSAQRLTFTNLWASELGADSERRPDGAACAVENRAWKHLTESWVQNLGPLGPGEKRTVRFCVEVVESDRCHTTQLFSTNGAGAGEGTAVYASLFVKVPKAGCTPNQCSADANAEEAAACCAAEAIHCVFHPSDSLCGGSASPTPAAQLARVVSSAVKAGARFFGTVDDLARLYVLRDHLESTPGGRGAVALYAVHQAELKRLLLADPALRERAIDVLTAWRPVIDGAIAATGAPTAVTSAQAGELDTFLAELRVVASPALRAAIDRESRALDLGSVAGLSVEQGLERLDKLTCIPDATTLCLSGGRVRVEAGWETRDGKRGRGRAVALTGDTGTFWFFGAANVETIVKVIDACTLNDRRWVFAAGLTDVGVATTVTDTVTGAVKTYQNPLGRRFAPVQDTGAFDCTP